MKQTIKRKSDLGISEWSGGTTTELFIYPYASSYKERNFEIRISSAAVNMTPSIFTALPKFHRLLMPIDASLRLVFDERSTVVVRPLETVSFEGAQKTESHGVCTDVGIIFSDKWRGELFAASDGICKFNAGFAGVYALCDNIRVIADGKEHVLAGGDFLIIETDSKAEMSLTLPHKNAAVVSLVYL